MNGSLRDRRPHEFHQPLPHHHRIQQAGELPDIKGTGSYAHAHLPGVDFGSDSGSGNNSSTNLDVYNVGFDASWEIDVFGGVRRSVEQAKAGTEAADWALRDGEVTLTAEVATDYLTLRTVQARTASLPFSASLTIFC